MAPSANGDTKSRIGPHPGHITSSNQYTSETTLRHQLASNGCDPAREDNYRLQGVQLLDNVREHLQLPVRTFDTACVYFHKFRLSFRDAEYNYQDAALASLFVACKVEDTIKKSKDILAAAYNVKNPDKPVAPDDKIFDSPGKVIIGLERLILETIGFDFRTRYPQKLLAKTIRTILPTHPYFFRLAYAMSIDMYKTFLPVKQPTFVMVMAITELTAMLTSSHLESVRAFAEQKRSDRAAVLESMLDLLDLYVQHHKSTKLGLHFDINSFMDIKICLNKEITPTESSLLPPNITSPPSPGSTLRYVFDPETARGEQETVAAYFAEEYEEYEVEIDEVVPPLPPPSAPRRDDRRFGRHERRGYGYRGRGGERGHRGRGRNHYEIR